MLLVPSLRSQHGAWLELLKIFSCVFFGKFNRFPFILKSMIHFEFTLVEGMRLRSRAVLWVFAHNVQSFLCLPVETILCPSGGHVHQLTAFMIPSK